MSSISCNLHFTNKPNKTIYASPDVIKRLGLSPAKQTKLKCGQKQVKASVKRIKRKGKHIYVPLIMRQNMKIPKSGQIMLSSNSRGELQLGPLIGILTAGSFRTATQPFGNRSGLIKHFLSFGSKKAFYFAFSPRDVNWANETVLAHFIGPEGQWIKKIVSLPDVIYNRLPSRRTEKTMRMISFKERFIRRSIPIFNWSFFDKWEVYDLLKGDADATKHVPESYINPSPEQIKEMLEKHRFVYLKPTAGSLGKGIYRLTYHHKRGYFARFRGKNRNVLLRFTQFHSLMRLVQKQKGKRLQNYVVQQGINLIELDHCPLDFRFHLNKDGQNQWVVAGIGAKKAGRGSITTHVRTGGQLLTPEQALSRIYSEAKANEIIKNMKKTSIKLAQAIERNYSHRIGEIGFDIGVDQQGNIWMFEANSKPGRSIFKHPSLKAQGRNSLIYIFEHCLYLSNFHVVRRNQQ